MSKQALCADMLLGFGLWIVLTGLMAVAPSFMSMNGPEKTGYYQISSVTSPYQDPSGKYQIVMRPISPVAR